MLQGDAEAAPAVRPTYSILKGLSPLLVAYDTQIGALNKEVISMVAILEDAKIQAQTLVTENEALQEKFQTELDLSCQHKFPMGQKQSDQMEHRLNLLVEENQLLSEHRDQLQEESEELRKHIFAELEEKKKVTVENVSLLSRLKDQALEMRALQVVMIALQKNRTDN